MPERVLNAQVFKRDGLRIVRIGSGLRYRDPLTPYVTTEEPEYGMPGGPMVARARIVLPDAMRDHTNAVVLQFERAGDVEELITLLRDVQRELSSTYPAEDEMEGPF